MTRYRAGSEAASQSDEQPQEVKPLPEIAHLWELLDRNISLEIWKKGI